MKSIKTCVGIFALALFSNLSYAEHTAPVYDVDSMSSASAADNAVQQDNSVKPVPAAPLITTSAPAAEPAAPAAPLSMEQRLGRLEQQLANTQQADEANRLAAMQTEVQSLRGQVEELTHQLQELSSHERTVHSEPDKQQLSKASEPSMSALPREGDEDGVALNKSVHAKAKTAAPSAENKLEGSTAKQAGEVNIASAKALSKKPGSHDKTAASVEQPNVAEEQAVYQTAYNLIKSKKYNEAIASLQKMLAKYPSGQFAANAHYWLGELYSLTGENEQAASEFSAVVKHYPNNPRVPDSELKLGLIFATELKWAEAKTSFNKIVHKYPGTTSARLAMEQLKQLKQAGH